MKASPVEELIVERSLVSRYPQDYPPALDWAKKNSLPERIILDEVRRAPDLFRAIKRSVDARRKPGRSLLTGTASVLVLPKISHSLAGRMEMLLLDPFSQGEVAGRREGFVIVCFAKHG